ncbi:ATP-binding protein [Streptomyces sp. RB6PN25]|uniref:histidine kinase n=1 Tax=Streptomyces humicola TaxID=2953240 RepID=A0ABT1PR70_9ACTN|nr:ATP-binding protein [Streptomyces humicola]MCQ4079450.1 ATP-binding protein [Streptomyces humicola]
MRLRLGGPTIRTRIIGMVLLPLVGLMGLWAFAMVSMTGDLRALIRVESVYDHFGTPVDTAVGQIQIERRLAAEYLASRGSAPALVGLTTQERATDEAVQAMRAAAADRGRQGDLTSAQRSTLSDMLTAADGLATLRKQVLARQLSWDRAVDAYTAIVEPSFRVESALTALQAGRLARESQTVIDLVQDREFVSREDAMGSAARAAGGFTTDQYRAFADTVEDRRVFFRTYVPDLPADSRELFENFSRSPQYTALVSAENAVLSAGPHSVPGAAGTASWRTTMDNAVHSYMVTCTDAAGNAAARGRSFARAELIRAGVAGGVGLLAVGLSIWFSVRTGRHISRRLANLRDAAGLLATHQLPDVVGRLSAGEQVDAAAEAPPLSFGDDEIGQVGRAFNEARRAAFEAAVGQARMRRGVSAVFLNIARRSQALLHRQLKLVDAMERRTTDPDELADLFRIDHLTTRMRRHAEGLIILSGAAPGRMWRNPVPVVEVVGAAVGEVEEYARVEVPPMPAVGIAAEAVADVVHLIAELVENATAFSPPQTQVTMRAGEAAHGFVLEIDDRGLGMDPDQLAEANRTLAGIQDFDLEQTERLGLFIVSRLARRHGIDVTLCRSPYGGTTAVVLLPSAVIADAGRDRSTERTEPAAVVAAPRPEHAALPKRVPQTSLASQPEQRADQSATEDEVTPEQMAAIFGSFQRGLARGRNGTEEGSDR